MDPLFVLETGEPFDEEKLLEHFKSSNDIRDVFFTSDRFRPKSPLNKLRNKSFHKVAFKSSVFEKVKFYDCLFEKCLLIGTEFLNCEFHDCVFRDCNTHKIKFEKTYIDPKSFTKLPNRKKYANIGVHLFHELYRNSHEMLQPDFKNTAEYEFRRWKRYETTSKWRLKKISNSRFAKQWFPNFGFFLISGYGLKSLRLLVWSALLFAGIVFFNYRYWDLFGFTSGTLDISQPRLSLSVYYTTVTLSTLGYGDITPRSEFGVLMTSFQALLGLVWLALVASVLIKRIIR